MAAPNTAYTGFSAYSKKETSPGNNNWVTVGHLIARRDIIANETELKNTFYLDKLMPFVCPDGATGFIGLVRIGGPNYEKHNPARMGAIRETEGTNNYVALSDGGLNTFGYAAIIDGKGSLLKDVDTIASSFLSPYYSTADVYLEAVQVAGSGTSNVITIPANTASYPNLLLDYSNLEFGNVDVIPVIESDEGVFRGTSRQFVIRPEYYFVNIQVLSVSPDLIVNYEIRIEDPTGGIANPETNILISFEQGFYYDTIYPNPVYGSKYVQHNVIGGYANFNEDFSNEVTNPLDGFELANIFDQIAIPNMIDNTFPVVFNNTPAVQYWYLGFTYSMEPQYELVIQINLYDDDKVTPVNVDSSIDIHYKLYFSDSQGPQILDRYVNLLSGDELTWDNIDMLQYSGDPDTIVVTGIVLQSVIPNSATGITSSTPREFRQK